MSESNPFDDIATKLRNGAPVEPITVRQFLSWFGAKRRGTWIVHWIRATLSQAGLRTEPDFESAFLDSPVIFVLASEIPTAQREIKASALPRLESSAISTRIDETSSPYADPTHRLSKLAAANRIPVSVSPDTSLREAVTILLTKDFSQLPVMVGERDVKGIVTWSSIGSRLALGKKAQHVREYMEPHHELHADASLFQAIEVIVDAQYVLIRGRNNKITGIVTASDLSLQFKQLSEPFLLLGEIENHLRLLLASKLTTQDFALAKDPSDVTRTVAAVEDLSFGEYQRLLENPQVWVRLDLEIDRQQFCVQLNHIRQIRNDVMHFDPDGIPDEDMERLRDFVRFLGRLQMIRVS
jgi:hypothetical protein